MNINQYQENVIAILKTRHHMTPIEITDMLRTDNLVGYCHMKGVDANVCARAIFLNSPGKHDWVNA